MGLLAEVVCARCGKKAHKKKAEVNRSLRLGRRIFCSLKCANSSDHRTYDSPRYVRNSLKILRRGSDVSPLGIPVGGDLLTPYRWFVLRAKHKHKKKYGALDIDAEYLKSLWESQEGRCPLTGWNMILPRNTNGWDAADPANASLDRIRSKEGYVRGNVRFVALMANLARSTFSDGDVVRFGQAVASLAM